MSFRQFGQNLKLSLRPVLYPWQKWNGKGHLDIQDMTMKLIIHKRISKRRNFQKEKNFFVFRLEYLKRFWTGSFDKKFSTSFQEQRYSVVLGYHQSEKTVIESFHYIRKLWFAYIKNITRSIERGWRDSRYATKCKGEESWWSSITKRYVDIVERHKRWKV